ncbi:MAG: 2-oxoacid:acceptor oxidoreductase family protein [Chloroflexota bacterium]|nr:2-oxoacid:acceptor oxidoreductase family protein [Chloroflexota bacterium]
MNVNVLHDSRICEIRWHGRGGQGAITSAQLLADTAYNESFLGVTASPTFGAERRGAPITASTRLSLKPVRIFSQIEVPDIVIVLDSTLLATANATQGLKPGGWLIVNTSENPDQLGISGDFSIATADATFAAQKVGLVVSGFAMVNTAMLGAFARTTEMISLESIKNTFMRKFSAQAAQKNYEAASLTFELTHLLRRGNGN